MWVMTRVGNRRSVLVAALVAGLLVFAIWLALPLVPLPRALFQAPASRWDILDRHGHSLREVREGDGPYVRRAALADISQPLVQATLAAEDKRFWQHPGVDAAAITRAAWDLVRHRRILSGGSTITMQLIKLAEPRPRTFLTKLIEAAQALRLEQVWDKQRILAEYLNRIEYGHLSAGCAEASAFFFGKPLRDLSVAECALLAGLPQGPSRLNPYTHFERARQRQHWILGQMRDNGFLTRDEYERACQEPLRLARPSRIFEAPHFVDLVLQLGVPPSGGSASAVPSAWEDRLSGGRDAQTRTIPTTLDLELNRFIGQTLRTHIMGLRQHQVRNGAVVVIENRSGDVLALVGSENYFSPRVGQVNGAWAPRSTGSALKPFTYLLAFEGGANPATVVADVPSEFASATGMFAPLNYDRHCHGPIRCRLALANSLNIPAVRLLASLGGAAPLQKRLQACGLTTLTNSPEHYGLGLTIGNAEARLLELANAYACLARLGEFKPYRLVRDSELVGQRVCETGAAYLVADILSDNAARAMTFGPESSLRFDFPVACKTGTSSDFRDNWAFGYTPEFTVGVWVGNFEGTPMEHISGVTGAAPILQDVFVYMHERYGTSWYEAPANIVERRVHPLTGKLIVDGRRGLTEKFLAHSLPPLESPDDYDEAGRVRLPLEYREWLASRDNELAGQVVLAESAPALRIISPLPGMVFYLDPDLPESSRHLALRAEGAGHLQWGSDSLACSIELGRPTAALAEGRHRLMVRDSLTGRRMETWILVKSL